MVRNQKLLGWVGIAVLVVVVVFGLWWLLTQPTPLPQLNADLTPSGSQGNGAEVTVVNRAEQSVGTLLPSIANISQGMAILNATGISSILTGKGPYTLFISTDKGFGLLPNGTISNMTAAQKKRFAQYSVVSGKRLDVDAVNSGSVRALSGDPLNFHVGGTGLVQINSSYALQEYRTKNGIIYVINQPLIPPQKAAY